MIKDYKPSPEQLEGLKQVEKERAELIEKIMQKHAESNSKKCRKGKRNI